MVSTSNHGHFSAKNDAWDDLNVRHISRCVTPPRRMLRSWCHRSSGTRHYHVVGSLHIKKSLNIDGTKEDEVATRTSTKFELGKVIIIVDTQ